MRQEAPIILEEMKDWVTLGGGDSGILGDENHSFGFHLPANELPSTDYSRWRDPNGADGPYVDNSYACAGDFSHKNKENLRRLHRIVLSRLLKGQLPMICEFIGKPWVDRPVYYWSRWNGKLELYTGSGHDHWSHISWYRSRVDQRAYLWRNTLEVKLGDQGWAVDFWMRHLGTLGFYKGKMDKIYGPMMQEAINKFRKTYDLGPLERISGWMATQVIEDIANLKAEVRVAELNKNLSQIFVANSKSLGELATRIEALESSPTPLPRTFPTILTGEVTISNLEFGEQNE